MRDRLIEILNVAVGDSNLTDDEVKIVADYLLANGVIVIDTAAVSVDNRPLISQCFGRPLDEIIELVQAKEDGRIIVPPCKVGQTIYWCDFVLHKVTDWTIARIDIYEDEIVYCNDCFDIFADEEIGVTVFLNREQAERALAERSEK